MKLINDFFEVIETSAGEAGFITRIKLNPNHIIYSGHFPNHPVTPAVILVQIVHELIEKHFSKKVKLISMSGCKFLKVLNPNETIQVVIHIHLARNEELLNIKARGEDGANTFFKLNAVYQFI